MKHYIYIYMQKLRSSLGIIESFKAHFHADMCEAKPIHLLCAKRDLRVWDGNGFKNKNKYQIK